MMSIAVIHENHEIGTLMVEHLRTIASYQNIPIDRIEKMNQSQLNDALIDRKIDQYTLFFFDSNLGSSLYFSLKERATQLEQPSIVILTTTDSKYLQDFLKLKYCPDGVLFEPIVDRELENILVQINHNFTRKKSLNPEISFKLKSKGQLITIPLSEIIFFESFGKKIALKTFGQELLFYSKFADIQEQLDKRFIRCHKGFILNTNQIKSISIVNMQISLTDQSTIPFSRTYKENLNPWLRRERLKHEPR